MRDSTEIFIPIPKIRNAQIKVEVGGDDLTGRTIESSFTKPVTNGIGTFKVKLSNASGSLTGTYSPGDFVKFYADNTDHTTLQFWGRIDNIKEVVGEDGKFLEIDGRHKSYLLTESLVCHSASSTEPSQILKDIIDKLSTSYGFTYSNVAATTTTMSVEWNYKPFWDCIVELCNFSGFDCYVDDNLDFHFFEENSITNTNDAIVEGDNLIDSNGWGIDNSLEKTRVTVMGENSSGLPIIYTAISTDEGDDIKEVFIKDSSANTEEKVKDIADAKLSEIIKQIPNATTKSFGLETINPGDNIWILIPRQEVHGQYKIIEITHKFGMKIGGWRTELIFERGDASISKVIKSIDEKTENTTKIGNSNKFNYSINFEFEEDSGTHSNTTILNDVLRTDGSATGSWVSDKTSSIQQVSQCELRVYGGLVAGTIFYISVDNGTRYEIITPMALKTISQTGQDIRVKVELNSASTQIASMVLLYS